MMIGFLPRSRIQLANLIRVTTVARPRMMGVSSLNPNYVQPFKKISVTATPNCGKQISVGSQTFIEETLGLPAQESFGWPQVEFNEAIGPDDRYVIYRKLAWGMGSSTWVARDKITNSYVAIKILTGTVTEMIRKRMIRELDTHRQVSSPSNPHCLQLLSDFTIPGKGSSGEHICLVTRILGGHVSKLCEYHSRISLPLPFVKRILLHALRGITHAHSHGVAHTDLRFENIFFDAHVSNSDIDKLLESDPSRRHPPEESYDGMMQAAVSQPLPMPTLQEAMGGTFVLASFHHAQPICDQSLNMFSVCVLRPPEIFIEGPWNEKVDIWTFGCLLFEVITGHALFKFQPWPPYNLDEINHILWQMICHTGENFSPEQLTASRQAPNFFDETCYLRSNPPFRNRPFERSIRCHKVIEEEDVQSTAAFLRRCLRLDPANRASAAELLTDPWFAGIDPLPSP
ncbi:kinase-like protein [Suillus ampliporus]|nr:kinase-like protein [Suillus ampliporus]